MIFLIQIKKLTTGEYQKGTSAFNTEKEALEQLYIAMSSAMQKDDTASILCMLTDEYGSQKKKEYWSAPVEPVAEPVEE